MTPRCWVEGAAGSGHDVDHLPYAVAAPPGQSPRVVVRVGDQALDLAAAVATADDREVARLVDLVSAPSLDPFLAAGPTAWQVVRSWLQRVLTDPAAEPALRPHLQPVHGARLLLPFTVADYVDFYASRHHATNVGRIFRPDGEPLHPNWLRLPVGYHGRSGTVVVSGTDVRRPRGQRRSGKGEDGENGEVVYAATERLDLEAELGFVVGVPSRWGEPVPTADFAEHVFGVVGLNDWSARDVQAWETAPLGPFLGKSFATSIAGWVTPWAALAAARVPLRQEPAPLPYLVVAEPAGLDVEVEVEVAGHVVARPPYAAMHWAPEQMLAHLTANGAGLRSGDLFGSGTISGPEKAQRGCLLELTWGGTEPFRVGDQERTWLRDGDEVVLRYRAPSTGGGHLDLGEVRGRVLPA